MGPWQSLMSASSLAFIYVGSLYIWQSNQDRDSPYTIRRRFLSAFCTVAISPFVVNAFGSEQLLSEQPFGAVIGIRKEGLLPASVIPLLLTAVLFAGPIAVMIGNELDRFRFKVWNWQYYLSDWIFWRNYIVAPFTEEFTFRACMLPILLGSFPTKATVLFSPMLFGIAHFHHMIERMKSGQSFKSAFLISSFQFTYTTIFGIYSAYLFIQTGHLSSCVIVHAFCNFMGFPDFSEVFAQPPLKRAIYSLIYVIGMVSFFNLLPAATNPTIYSNKIFKW